VKLPQKKPHYSPVNAPSVENGIPTQQNEPVTASSFCTVSAQLGLRTTRLQSQPRWFSLTQTLRADTHSAAAALRNSARRECSYRSAPVQRQLAQPRTEGGNSINAEIILDCAGPACGMQCSGRSR